MTPGLLQASSRSYASESSRPQLALTIDDPKLDLGIQMTWQEANRRLLEALDKRKLKTALFVCGTRVDKPEGTKLLGDWDSAGQLLCNHSYSHKMYMQKTSFDDFAADFLRNEPILKPYRNVARLFRYPFLKEGDTAEKRDQFRSLLKEHDYRVGHVTIDASDWYVDQRMRERQQREAKADLGPYRDYLIGHLLDRARFYRQLALDVLGREVRHTLLVHYTVLNALFLPDVLTAFEKAGWQWINAEHAFQDPVFLRESKTLPAGESLIWALASETDKFKDRLRWPGEDDVYEKPKMDALGL
jgi:peptidoglycan/xylan/chitin deacetylase (PgdA/CDA1 family)